MQGWGVLEGGYINTANRNVMYFIWMDLIDEKIIKKDQQTSTAVLPKKDPMNLIFVHTSILQMLWHIFKTK